MYLQIYIPSKGKRTTSGPADKTHPSEAATHIIFIRIFVYCTHSRSNKLGVGYLSTFITVNVLIIRKEDMEKRKLNLSFLEGIPFSPIFFKLKKYCPTKKSRD